MMRSVLMYRDTNNKAEYERKRKREMERQVLGVITSVIIQGR